MRTRHAAILAACVTVVVALVAACAAGGPPAAAATRGAPPVGRSEQHVTVDGVDRTFHVYRPAAVPTDRPVPLVIMLHGGFGSGTQAEEDYGWDAEADRGGFVVAYPDGLDRAWNVGGGCCGKPGAAGVDDVRFLTDVVARLSGELRIDPRRVYATGMSNGALMAYRLACDTDAFAAIAPVAGTQLGACPAPQPVSILHIHGTADEHVPYDGGRGQGTAHIDGPAVPALVARWRAVDRCGPPIVTVDGAVTTSTAACPRGRSVELVTVAGAGHQWPGSPPHPARQKLLGADAPSTAIDATSAIWTFFSRHPMPTTGG